MSGNTTWLQKKDWQDFCEFEEEVNKPFAAQPITRLCTYSLAASGVAELLEAASTHQFAIVKRKGHWEVVETTSQLRQAKKEVEQLNEELEQRVVERTRALAVINEEPKQEITERKRTEVMLYAERTFVSAVLATADALIVVTDPRCRIVRFNRACERLTGYTFDEVHNRYVWELAFLPEEMKPLAQAFWAQPPTEPFPSPYENDWVAKDGSRRLISWSNTAMRDEHGYPEYFVRIGVDITERKRAEELLTERAHLCLRRPRYRRRADRGARHARPYRTLQPGLRALERLWVRRRPGPMRVGVALAACGDETRGQSSLGAAPHGRVPSAARKRLGR